jgi:tRNA-dihydrouridine synthase
VTGNGDVRSHADAEAMRRATGCAGVMVGRGALGAPWVFAPAPPARAERARVIRRHCQLIMALLPERSALLQLRRHLAWYADGLPGAGQARAAMFRVPDATALQALFWTLWEGAPALL